MPGATLRPRTLALRRPPRFDFNALLRDRSAILFDPSDLSSVWQDSAGTVAGAVNSPIGRLTDKSGNGSHATQATAGQRPTLRQASGRNYAEFITASSTWLSCPGFISLPPQFTIVLAASPGPAVAQGNCIYLRTTGSLDYALLLNDTGTPNGIRSWYNGAALAEGGADQSGVLQVVSSLHKEKASHSARRNGQAVVKGNNTSVLGASYLFSSIGSAVSGDNVTPVNFGTFNLYWLFMIGRVLPLDVLREVERIAMPKVGLTP